MHRLRTLVIKPVLHCNANCSFCSSRLALHEQSAKEPAIDLQGWKDVILDAAGLGAKKVAISGGEPTLYKELPELIRFIKEQGLSATLNSNGILLDRNMINVLEEAGLDQIMLSMYSHRPDVHDMLKCTPGVFAKSTEAMEALKESSILLHIQTILTRPLLAELDRFIEWAVKMGPASLALSYLEGNQTKGLLPARWDILKFRGITLPRCRRVLHRHLAGSPRRYSECETQLNRLFKPKKVSLRSLTKGIYNPPDFHSCGRPNYFCIILANGDIHPCNAVEYFHKPLVGNVLEKPLREWWNGALWEDVREKGTGWCQICPMAHHVTIGLK